MKISPISQTNMMYSPLKSMTNVAFRGEPDNAGDKFELQPGDGSLYKKMERFTDVHALHAKFEREFLDLVHMDKEGKRVEMPNCIMLCGQNSEINGKLIDWVDGQSKQFCNVVKLVNEDIDVLQDVLSEALETSEEGFKATKKRTLIHVEGFDRLINPEINEFENIAGLKSIMDRCATECGATIIFSTKDTSKLAIETIQPHRVTSMIDVDIEPSDLKKYHELRNRWDVVCAAGERGRLAAEAKSAINNTSPIKTETKIETVSQEIKKASKSSKIFKVLAVIIAIGGAIAGVRYLMKNKKAKQAVKENVSQPSNVGNP